MNGRIISWTRSDLKWRAKQAFRKNYWSAVLVSLVLAIVLASGGKGAAQSGAGNVMNSVIRSIPIIPMASVPMQAICLADRILRGH